MNQKVENAINNLKRNGFTVGILKPLKQKHY